MPSLFWLPAIRDFRIRLKRIADGAADSNAWDAVTELAGHDLDFVQTNSLDNLVRNIFRDGPPGSAPHRAVRVALLGTSTLGHLHGAIRVAGLRHGLWLSTYEGAYGQYLQEIVDVESGLHRFRPGVVVFAFDARHVTATLTQRGTDADACLSALHGHWRECWDRVRSAFSCRVIQQAVLPCLPRVLGSNEHRLPSSKSWMVDRVNVWLRQSVEADGVDLLSLDAVASETGIQAWHDVALWHRAKQEVSPIKAPMYGDLVARLVAAQMGRSRKCLILDLDNTLWGGVAGDDGLEGLELGQGSALGESFVAFQEYLLALSARGVVLAICSKNDESVAFAVFDTHPEMVLRRNNIACFVANWQDKPANIRHIAAELNLGLDSMVFFDDSPFERDLVRRELPMVAVPESGEDPAGYPAVIQSAGYFEAIGVTAEDQGRSEFYQAARARAVARSSSTDIGEHLRELRMELRWSMFDEGGLKRVEQLVNKTNQFNLRTRRYGLDDLRKLMRSDTAFGLQFRLLDRYGDNGMIAVVICTPRDDDMFIDTWLMSCRVLGRQVEQATINAVAKVARSRGARRLLGEYLPTPRNGMVANLYERLGFTPVEQALNDARCHALDLTTFRELETFIGMVGSVDVGT